MDQASGYLDVVGAAQFLRVTKATIYAWVHQRKLPFRKHGSRLAFSREELEIWSQSRAVRPIEHQPIVCDKNASGSGKDTQVFENQAHR